MPPTGTAGELEVGGRRLRIRHLDRVLFPRTGTTKGELLNYYVAVSGVMLPHLRERLLHMHRYPEGVEGPRFWQKGCPEHRPDWMPTAPVWSRDKGEHIEYCVVNELPALLWAVNLGSLELHTSLHLRTAMHQPTVIAFDLDPGPGTNILHCAEVAVRIRDLFARLRMSAYPKTSGSKGLQVYVPLNTDISYGITKPASRRIARTLEEQTPEAVVSRMARSLRGGRVLIDWSQNTEHKSMVCAYSVRARERPTVSTPLRWTEIEAALGAGDPDALRFEMGDVLARVGEHGDLFGAVLSERQSFHLAA
ncbi:MAG TPA: non-homologous end-joining DNA ligase [Solirubrobacteraceae bacterium]|nr:non-homologous end-joining DNA ligase [Solirubrobacteraceae bacterium]